MITKFGIASIALFFFICYTLLWVNVFDVQLKKSKGDAETSLPAPTPQEDTTQALSEFYVEPTTPPPPTDVPPMQPAQAQQTRPANTYGTPAAAVGTGVPKTLRIPKIGVNARFESIGLDSQQRMDVPKSFSNVGWYNLGWKPGDNGSAVVSGHYDTASGSPAVFYNLKNLAPGDILTVVNDKGETINFSVTEVKTFPYDQLPLERIFATSGRSELNLITCAGTWNRNQRNYSDRVVVYSTKVN